MKTFLCPHSKSGLRLTHEGCGKIYRRVFKIKRRFDAKPQSVKHQDRCFLDSNSNCLTCGKGEKNMGKIEAEVKSCPCGKEFSRRDGEAWTIWCRRKYCPEHARMDPYKRKKELEKMANNDPKKKQKKTIEYTRKCAWCGEEFTTNAPTRKYHNDKCARAADNDKEKIRKKARLKTMKEAMKFDPDKASDIAVDVTDDILTVIAPFTSDETQLEQIKAVAQRVGVECQRRMIGAA